MRTICRHHLLLRNLRLRVGVGGPEPSSRRVAELEEKERARAREVWERDRQRLARRQREQEEREAKAAKRKAHLGRDGAARLERMMAFRRAKGLGRRLQERDLDEEKNVCIEGREVLAGMTRGVG